MALLDDSKVFAWSILTFVNVLWNNLPLEAPEKSWKTENVLDIWKTKRVQRMRTGKNIPTSNYLCVMAWFQ